MTQDDSGAAFFAQVSQDLMREHEEEPTLQRVADRALSVVAGADHCGISLRRRRGRVETAAATSETARHCDQLQYDLGDGPCLEAVWKESSYLICDTAASERWPAWGRKVADAGVGSVLSIRLANEAETLGALNLYAASTDGFAPDDVDVAVVYAAHATNAMKAAQLISGLSTAVESRHLIGVAQGILMHRFELSMEDAFEVLRRYSSHTNVKLREVAALVVDTRSLPDLGDRPGIGHVDGRAGHEA